MAEKRSDMTTGNRLDKPCRCLFCGGEFTAGEIEFCVNRKGVQNADWYDQVFEDHLAKYKDCDLEVPYRQWLDWADDAEHNVIVWEEEGTVPKVVSGTLRDDDESRNVSGFGSGFSFGSFLNQQEETEEAPEKPVKKERYESSVRVCPHCHMTIPEGFMTYPIVRVGLLGGPRSGKTTYMTVATEYMMNRFGDLDNGLELGDVSLVYECEEYIGRLYETTMEETVGLSPTTIDDDGPKDPPILPVMMLVRPYEKDEPFYLILQDIPGEYFKSENRDLLSASNIRDSTDLIMLVDVNHFVKTRQQTSEDFGEYCRLELNRMFNNLRYLGERMNKKQLNSIQIAVTKMDFWQDADRRIANSELGTSADALHRGGVNVDRLDKVHRLLRNALSTLPNHDYSRLLDNMQKQMGIREGSPVHKAYVAVASRNVKNMTQEDTGSQDYSQSVNVLEPLLRILEWHGLLPVRSKWS